MGLERRLYASISQQWNLKLDESTKRCLPASSKSCLQIGSFLCVIAKKNYLL